MPRKREGDPQKRVHVWLYESDWEMLRTMYADSVGPSKFVRQVVRMALKKVQERTNGTKQPIDQAAIDRELADIESADKSTS